MNTTGPSSEEMQLAKGPGRPRNTQLDIRIREAAWVLIAELGCEGMTFEAIAQAAGCSRSSLYRRFANKGDLVSHLLDETARSFAPQFAVDASPRQKLIAHATTCAIMYAGDRGSALLHISAEARRDEVIAQALDAHQRLVEPHYRAPLSSLVPSASEGAVNFALHTLIGSVLHHVSTRRQTLTDDAIERLVDAAIHLTENWV